MNAKETPISPTYYKILFAILLVLATGLAVWAGYNHLQVNMAMWQWVFTSPGIRIPPRPSISRAPACAARHASAAAASAVTSAMRRPSTPTYPSKQFGSPAAAVIGSTLQFRKNSVIISLRRSNFPAP